MKPSRFNIFIDNDNGATLAFNSASATLAEIFPDKLPIIERLIQSPGSVSNTEEAQYMEALLEGRYIIDDAIDELTVLKVRNRQQRFGNSVLMLTIAPTLACNFRCDYCFENQSASHMDRKTEEALLKFSDERLRRSTGLLVTWFGGEPTLCLETIERLQCGLQQMCARHEVVLQPSSIITNGYLLDKAMAMRLTAAGVGEAQITLDGPARVHDLRRKLAGGGGSYSRILENLKASADILRIGVRINVDRHNYASTTEVLRDLEAHGLLQKVYPYFAQVQASTGVCADIRNRCFSTEEFSREQVEMYRDLMAGGFGNVEYPMLSAGGHCSADTDNSFVVAPNGDLFKCWEELSGDSTDSVGSVHQAEPTPEQLKKQYSYLAWDPLEKAGCRECNILPICMGGCPRHALQQDSPSTGACCSWKFNLKEMLMLRYQCDLRKEVNS